MSEKNLAGLYISAKYRLVNPKQNIYCFTFFGSKYTIILLNYPGKKNTHRTWCALHFCSAMCSCGFIRRAFSDVQPRSFVLADIGQVTPKITCLYCASNCFKDQSIPTVLYLTVGTKPLVQPSIRTTFVRHLCYFLSTTCTVSPVSLCSKINEIMFMNFDPTNAMFVNNNS